uniref:Reverse transcriptase zinc-binding domain-containing protein n=1 Tax=Lactuca sativa TaxID=4236 RepID=A0A9R1VGP9_LACSA|nr:hypothetical protein LSAT_V11C500285210 [Lactuca sativa]
MEEGKNISIRVFNEPEVLWVKVLKFFHRDGGGFLGGSRILSGGVIGNGATIRFWHDVWCLDVPIMEYWSSSGWVFAWCRDIRGGVDQKELAGLVILLEGVRLGMESDGCGPLIIRGAFRLNRLGIGLMIRDFRWVTFPINGTV